MRGILLPLAVAGAMTAAPAMGVDQWTPAGRDPSVQMRFGPVLSNPVADDTIAYAPEAQAGTEGGERPVDKRPPVEIGRRLYEPGHIGDGIVLLGDRPHPALSVFGNLRLGAAFNDNGARDAAVAGARADLNFRLELTATERLQLVLHPLWHTDFPGEFAGERSDFSGVTDKEMALFFEGDVGAITGWITDDEPGWRLPFAAGQVPLTFQSGVWMDDAVLGLAVTLPARNPPVLGITHPDLTFFAGWDEVDTPAFTNDEGQISDHNAHLYGIAAYFDVAEGHVETGYAYLQDTDTGTSRSTNQSYHNLAAAFSRRYFGRIANTTRAIVNLGQDDPPRGLEKTASGFMLLSETAVVRPSLPLIPYANFFLGKDAPRKVAGETGLLRNVGLSFETDGLTGFPRLNDTGHDALGGAIGTEYLLGYKERLVGEIAFQIPWDDRQGILGSQSAISAAYERPLTDRLIFRADAIYGWLSDLPDIAGVRGELRLSF